MITKKQLGKKLIELKDSKKFKKFLSDEEEKYKGSVRTPDLMKVIVIEKVRKLIDDNT